MNDPEETHYIECIFGHEICKSSNVSWLLMAVLFFIFVRWLLFLGDTPRRQSKSFIVNQCLSNPTKSLTYSVFREVWAYKKQGKKRIISKLDALYDKILNFVWHKLKTWRAVRKRIPPTQSTWVDACFNVLCKMIARKTMIPRKYPFFRIWENVISP